MLNMPQMIQTWKEVSFPYVSEDMNEMLIHDYRGVMVVDGRNGRNKPRGRHCLGQEELAVRIADCTNIMLGTNAFREALQTIASRLQEHNLTFTHQKNIFKCRSANCWFRLHSHVIDMHNLMITKVDLRGLNKVRST